MEIPEPDNDRLLQSIMHEYNSISMQCPSIDEDPHLLITQVRKHYYDHLIKLLSINYENNQRILGKNMYLPSAIWRCAKNIELDATKACMVTEMYRRNIMEVITKLKSDTKKGKLNRILFESLLRPTNEKGTQTSESYLSTCSCKSERKKKRKISVCTDTNSQTGYDFDKQYQIPVVINNNTELPQVVPVSQETTNKVNDKNEPNPINQVPRMSCDSHESPEDEVMLQLEKLFQADTTENDDDLFQTTLCGEIVASVMESTNKTQDLASQIIPDIQGAVNSLDARLAMLETSGILNTAPVAQVEPKHETPKHHKPQYNKWVCEEYYQKLYLYEKLDFIRDTNRKKFLRVKTIFLDLFGDEIYDEDIMSPLEETTTFVNSCKERMAPWIVKLLTPCYTRGRIKGKALFKSVAKHLINLIYQCSGYPSEYEVHFFVTDFLKNHQLIRCEADFKDFRIPNVM